MIRTKSRMRLCVTLTVLLLCFIWGNSLMPAEISSAFSQWVKGLLSFLLPAGPDEDGGHGLLRKLAHFTEFCALGMCLGWLHSMRSGKEPKITAWPLICGCAAACIDEIIQIFSPGRNPSVWDVLLDTSGVLAGIILLTAGYLIRKRTKMYKLEEDQR